VGSLSTGRERFRIKEARDSHAKGTIMGRWGGWGEEGGLGGNRVGLGRLTEGRRGESRGGLGRTWVGGEHGVWAEAYERIRATYVGGG